MEQGISCNIWATNNLAGIVISGKNFELKIPVIHSSTWNFVFEKTPSADNCIVGPDYLEEDYFLEKS